MTYLDHIDDLDILQYPSYCAVQLQIKLLKQWLEETLGIYKLITNK